MWDIPPIQLTVTQFDLVCRRCPAGPCQHGTHRDAAGRPAGLPGLDRIRRLLPDPAPLNLALDLVGLQANLRLERGVAADVHQYCRPDDRDALARCVLVAERVGVAGGGHVARGAGPGVGAGPGRRAGAAAAGGVRAAVGAGAGQAHNAMADVAALLTGGHEPEPDDDQPVADEPHEPDEPDADRPKDDQPAVADADAADEPGDGQPGGDQPGGDQPGGDQPGAAAAGGGGSIAGQSFTAKSG